MKMPVPKYTIEQKEFAFKRLKFGQPIASAAMEFGVSAQAIPNRVNATASGALAGSATEAVIKEQMELL